MESQAQIILTRATALKKIDLLPCIFCDSSPSLELYEAHLF